MIPEGGGETDNASKSSGSELILPKKIPNPCLESAGHKDLHRELLFNNKIGRSVLNQKSELQRAMEKHKDERIKKELSQVRLESRTPFEKVIDERAKRLEEHSRSNNTSEDSKGDTEFHKVHARMRARMDSK